MPESKEEWRKRFDERPEDKGRKEALAKADAVHAGEMKDLTNHVAWERLKQHEQVHRENLVKELAQIKDTIVLAVAVDDIRVLQMRHAYKQGIVHGMQTIMNAPEDLSKPSQEAK